jgi:hypothetical protein
MRSELHVMVEALVLHTCRYLLDSAIDSLDGRPGGDHHRSGQEPDARVPAAAGPDWADRDWAGPDRAGSALSLRASAQGRQLSWELGRHVRGGALAVYRGRLLAYGDSHSTQLHSILTAEGPTQMPESNTWPVCTACSPPASRPVSSALSASARPGRCAVDPALPVRRPPRQGRAGRRFVSRRARAVEAPCRIRRVQVAPGVSEDRNRPATVFHCRMRRDPGR